MAAKAPAEEWDIDGIAVRVSSPDKIYYPQLGPENGTKRHLVDYYRTVATELYPNTPQAPLLPNSVIPQAPLLPNSVIPQAPLLPNSVIPQAPLLPNSVIPQAPLLHALWDRPTYLQRFPDGVEGAEIYQKRLPAKRPEHLEGTTVPFPSGRTAEVLRVTHPANIVWAAQMGTVTFHSWPAVCPDTDHPDELRIDLDPQPGTGFDEARTVALDVLKPVLDDFGLFGFPKTSGGRGLHVYIAIEPNWEITEVRRAGIALAREVERRSGDRATTKWWKEERGQRVFLDYNQNARDRTIASAYSARKTPIATVSTPVTWAELADVHPDDFTIATVPALLARRGDPMASLGEVKASLDGLLELAARDVVDGLGDMPYPPNYPKMPGEPKRVQPSKARSD